MENRLVTALAGDDNITDDRSECFLGPQGFGGCLSPAVFFASTFSIAPPASRHAVKPPPMWATGVRPISCATLAATADRQPLAQWNTNFLSSWKIGFAYGLAGSIQNSSMQRGQENAPGMRHSRSISRGSRRLTITVSAMLDPPCGNFLTASAAWIVSTTAFASTSMALYPRLIVCGMGCLAPSGLRSNYRTSSRIAP